MRAMAAKQPEYFLPAHGLPIRGVKQINEVLINCARVLEDLVADTLSMMNQGARRNDIIHSVKVDPALATEIYKQRVATETSLMSKGIFGSAMKTSLEHTD